jgi:hypothetical protein
MFKLYVGVRWIHEDRLCRKKFCRAYLFCINYKYKNFSQALNLAGKYHNIQNNTLIWPIIKTHPQGSYEIIDPIPFKTNVAEIVIQHHERLDGSGYPKGLEGKDISIGAKILGVVDVIEAMSSHRPHRLAIGWQLICTNINQ